MKSSFRHLIAMLALTLSSISWADACTVPVFRYALERWPADPHLVALRETPSQAFFNSYATNWYPESALPEQTVDADIMFYDEPVSWYQGPWSAEIATSLADSPARRQITDLLLRGASGVLVYIPRRGAGAKPDAALLRDLTAHLATLEDEVTLPEKVAYTEDDEHGEGLVRIPLTVRFPIVVVPRDDLRETALQAQLEALVDGWMETPGPLMAMVFGRGRAIPLLAHEETIGEMSELARFLCGACSCQVKDLNPGIDLLLSADWEIALSEWPNGVTNELDHGVSFTVGGGSEVPPATVIDLRQPTTSVADAAASPAAAATTNTSVTAVIIATLISLGVIGTGFIVGRRDHGDASHL